MCLLPRIFPTSYLPSPYRCSAQYVSRLFFVALHVRLEDRHVEHVVDPTHVFGRSIQYAGETILFRSVNGTTNFLWCILEGHAVVKFLVDNETLSPTEN